jgi:hypothetical protein
MRASNEVTVDRREFLASVTRIPRGGLCSRAEYSPRKTLIYADPPVLIVETPYVRTEVAAKGRWEQPVAVSARLLITVARKLPKTDSITLLYANGRLYFDRLSIDATPAAGMRPTRRAELGVTPEWAPTPTRVVTPAGVGGPSTADAGRRPGHRSRAAGATRPGADASSAAIDGNRAFGGSPEPY